jgi:SAM-dependent methyltransferase
MDYRGKEGQAYQEQVHGGTSEVYMLVANARAKKFQGFLDRNKRILEYGSGNCWNIMNLQAKEKYAFDLFYNPSIDYATHGINFFHDLDGIPKNHFDIVLCHHVLEHLINPFEELQKIKSFLKQDGRLIIFVPYEINRRFRKYNPKDKNHHLFSWSVQSLGAIVEEAGFRITDTEIFRTGYDRYAAMLITRFRLPKRCYSLVRWFLRVLRPDFEILVVAKQNSQE